jgi:phosphoglycerate dehydrogenase-like enzyme
MTEPHPGPRPAPAGPVTVLAMGRDVRRRLFTPALLDRLGRVARVDTDLVLDDFSGPAADAALRDVEILLTGWGCPPVDAAVLDRAPGLRAVVHAAGSVKGHLDGDTFRRGIAVSSAAHANAIPVAEFTLAVVLLANKGAFAISHAYRTRRSAVDLLNEFPAIGNYDRTVGVVGASRTGRRVIELLRPFDLEVLVSDPYLTGGQARGLGARWVELDELVAGSDVVTLHAPALPGTRHLLDRRRLAAMPDGAVLVNTARGSLVDQDALLAELVSGRLSAVIDVTDPEVPPPDSPWYRLPNVFLTPHLAGSAGREVHRLARCAVEEIERLASGAPLRYPVRPDELARMA